MDPISYNLARWAIKKPIPPYSAIVCKDENTVWAGDSSDKTIALGEAGVDDASVIQSALDSLTGERTWKERVVLLGDFVASGIKIPGYTIFELYGKITNPNPSANYIIEIMESNIELIGGIYDGNRGTAYNTEGSNLDGSGIYIHGETPDVAPENIVVRDITIKNTYNRGIVVRNLKKSLFDNVTIENAGWGGFDLAVASGAPYPSLCTGNTLRKIKVLNSQVVGISPGLSVGNELIACYVEGTAKPPEFTGYAEGIGIDSSRNLDVIGCTIRNCEIGIDIHTSINSNPFQVTVIGCKTFNNSVCGYKLAGARSCMLDSIKSYNDVVGIYVERGYGNQLQGFHLKNNTKQGVYLKDTRNVVITGRIEDADREENGNYAIHIAGGRDVHIVFCHLEEVWDGEPRTMKGIYIEDGSITSGNVYVLYNDIHLTSTSFTNVSSGNNFVLKGNGGHITENSGTASFSGDGTTTDFEIGAHGLVTTDPSKIVVKVSPISSDAIAASPCVGYVDPADNTKIRVKFSSAPASGADNVQIVWEAQVVS